MESGESLGRGDSVASMGSLLPPEADDVPADSSGKQSTERGYPPEALSPGLSNGAADDATASSFRRKGIRLKVTAFLVLIAGFAGMGLLDGFMTEINQTHKILIKIYAIVLIYLAYRLHRAGRYYAQKAKELATSESHASVIYLRSFAADPMTTKVRISGITEEEQIVGILNTIGPVISLDNPVTEVAAPGAKRISVGDLEWKIRVFGLMQKARLVVIRLGDSPSLHWEIAQARRILQPEKLLLIVPLQKLFDYEGFKSQADRELAIRIQHTDFSEPISQILIRILTLGRRFQDYYSFQGFVYFDDEWNGRVAAPRFTWKGYLHSPLTQPGRANIAYVLKPVFERVGAPEPALPYNWFLCMLVIAIGGGGIVGLLAHLFGKSL